jgi:hypothetical protein
VSDHIWLLRCWFDYKLLVFVIRLKQSIDYWTILHKLTGSSVLLKSSSSSISKGAGASHTMEMIIKSLLLVISLCPLLKRKFYSIIINNTIWMIWGILLKDHRAAYMCTRFFSGGGGVKFVVPIFNEQVY